MLSPSYSKVIACQVNSPAGNSQFRNTILPFLTFLEKSTRSLTDCHVMLPQSPCSQLLLHSLHLMRSVHLNTLISFAEASFTTLTQVMRVLSQSFQCPQTCSSSKTTFCISLVTSLQRMSLYIMSLSSSFLKSWFPLFYITFMILLSLAILVKTDRSDKHKEHISGPPC